MKYQRVKSKHQSRPNGKIEGSLVNVLDQNGEIVGLGLFIKTQKLQNNHWHHRILIDGELSDFDAAFHSLLPV